MAGGWQGNLVGLLGMESGTAIHKGKRSKQGKRFVVALAFPEQMGTDVLCLVKKAAADLETNFLQWTRQ